MRSKVYKTILTAFCLLTVWGTGCGQSFETLDRQIQKAVEQDDIERANGLVDQAILKAKIELTDQHRLYGSYLADKGALAFRVRDYAETISWAKKAELVFNKYTPDSITIENLVRLGMALLESGKIDTVDAKIRKAERLIITTPMSQRDKLLSAIHRGLGVEYALLQDWSKATYHYRQAASLLKKQREYAGYVTALSELIMLLNRTDPDESLRLTNEIREIVYIKFKGRHPAFGNILRSEGILWSQQGDQERAEASLIEAHKAFVAQTGELSITTASSHRTLGNFYQTVKKDFAKAEARLLEAISIMNQMGLPTDAVVTHTREDLSYLYMSTNQYDKVAVQLREAHKAAKDRHQLSFGMASEQQKEEYLKTEGWGLTITPPFAAYILQHQPDTLIQQLSYNAALYLNGLLLDDARKIRNRVRQGGDSTVSRLYENWLLYKQTTAKLPAAERAFSVAKLNDMEEQLVRRSSAFQTVQANTVDVTWEQIKQKLQSDQAAIAFVRFRAFPPKRTTEGNSTFYAAMVIRPGYTYPRFVLLGDEKHIRQLLTDSETPTDLYANARGPRFGTVTYGDSLYRFVWQPIDSLLQGVRRVYFSADGLLHRVAFAALPLPGTNQKTPVTDRYLSSRYDLHQLFSTRQVAQGIRPLRWQPGMSAALLGGITYEPDNSSSGNTGTDTTGANASQTYLQTAIQKSKLNPFPSLDATELEVVEIHRLLPQSELITGKDASEKRFKQLFTKPRTILHVATHGLYIPDESGATQPGRSDEALMRSGLAMAGANRLWNSQNRPGANEDGILTAYEVGDQDLSQTRLVVLSACETALGDLRGPEGVFGLQRSFRLAGAEKLLMSLWPVDDDPTRQLMKSFYTNLKAGQEVRTAFRMAQRTIQKQFPDPTIWAAFVLIE